MKDIRIFVASSKELLPERNYLAYLALACEGEFERLGFRVRLSKWEYVDPTMTEVRTEDRYLDEMYNCDAALVLFRDFAGMYTREELDKALAREQAGYSRLKAHQILFAADGKADSDAEKLRESLPPGSYGVWSGMDELRTVFLSLVEKVAQCEGLVDAPSDKYVRKITAFLAADEELAEERNAFADTVLNVNDLLEQAHRNIRVQLKFYDPANAESVIESSEMGLVLYGTNYRMFGSEEIKRVYERVKEGTKNPKRFYVFFRDLDEATEKSLDEAFKTFRSDFVSKLGHFICQFGDTNALRLGFLLSLERYAGESIEIYSTVSAPTTPVFVGRENELRRLSELLEPVPGKFPAGRLPVITGAGGTGKSELVHQYASQRRVQYLGGVFQVDMEHVKTWDEAFLGILKGNPNNGVKVEEYLDLKEEEGADGDRSGKHMTGAKVRDALLRRARETGPVLLVLDNVEGCTALLGRDGGFRKAFPTGFSERVRVNVVATARVCDVVLRETDWAVPFPLGDLSQDAALEVLLADRPEANAEERKAAGRVAELLGYRALYLRRVPALIGDLYAQTVCDSYVELAKSLEEDLLGTVAEETEGTHLPDVLWSMTRERLLKIPLGAECVKLAQVASFFSPNGFPQHILKHLWKTVIVPEPDDRKFERVFAILQRHNVFQSEDPVRIHRLDRAAILRTAKDAFGLEDAVGVSLSSYKGMTQEDWLSLAESSSIVNHIPLVMLNGWLLGDILRLNSDFADICPWDRLDGGDWAWLLGEQPQFAAQCDWDKLRGWDWAELLSKQPQFADRCDWDKLRGWDWARLLSKQPQFADRCDWESLDGKDWTRLLENQPQFVNRCEYDKLKGENWSQILKQQPQLADICPWKKLDGNDWVMLLEKQPQFSDNCSWGKFIGNHWMKLLEKQPQFADKCDWRKLNGWDWARLLRRWLQFADKCQWEKLSSSSLAWLLSCRPQFAGRCKLEMLDGNGWSRLLGTQPQFADRCPWEKLNGKDWERLLSAQPQFADKCAWEKLYAEAWADLLVNQPQFAIKCDWEKLCGRDWVKLLRNQPQFAHRCPWEKLSGADWVVLLRDQPQFTVEIPWGKLDNVDWVNLLSSKPQFADRCPWEKWDGGGWAWLLGKQPQFADMCPWDELDGNGWSGLLSTQPQFADRCPWEELNGEDWATLLCVQPHFVDEIPWWNLDGWDWAELLGTHPDFADKCPWDALDGQDWMRLLSCQSQFFDRCPWEKLDTEDWTELLMTHPQFAMYCNKWDDMDDDSILELICMHPELKSRLSEARLRKLEESS